MLAVSNILFVPKRQIEVRFLVGARVYFYGIVAIFLSFRIFP